VAFSIRNIEENSEHKLAEGETFFEAMGFVHDEMMRGKRHHWIISDPDDIHFGDVMIDGNPEKTKRLIDSAMWSLEESQEDEEQDNRDAVKSAMHWLHVMKSYFVQSVNKES